MTTAYRTVGCCIDRSPAADLVIDEAVRLRSQGTVDRIHLVHVVEEPPPLHAGPFTYRDPPSVLRAEGERWLAEKVASVRDAIPELLGGPRVDAVCEWAEVADADLLICAPHHGGFARALHGEFAGDLIYRASCPVLVLRPGPAPR